MDIENTARSSFERKIGNMEHVEDKVGTESIRAPIASELPVKEVIESHMTEDDERVKKILRKVDIRLVGVLAVLYVTAFLDRSNLGNVSYTQRAHIFSLTWHVRLTLLVWVPILSWLWVIAIPSSL